MSKIRGLKRKYKTALDEYQKQIKNFDGYAEIYVPQISHKEIKSKKLQYQTSNFLIKHTIKNIPSKSNFMYLLDENEPLSSHLIITTDENDLELNFTKQNYDKKPDYIKLLESKYNLKFNCHLVIWEMGEDEYINLEENDKRDILYIKQEDDKILAITNVLWTYKDSNI
ncbi:hypothetical protein [Mammaliicoccus sp. Dog046]|uniref:hypothetical protein n=1 Tax=Mammaliicoccus sp. Dog046 TaxID=3034233 RepID=UPI002B25B614|nr:hypothetical protein [Mammaliicoccus sp. Dog046]WQK84402.1 hypothetical protein P3U32_07090 [Mammaliicoccus sp. Dog046]